MNGDSAGGNLILAIFSHLLHPHPSVEPLALASPLLGAAAVSPWGSFDTSASSYISNQDLDSIDAPVLKKWSAYYMGSAEADEYNQPFIAEPSWWKDLPNVVQSILVTAGSYEVLLDDIKAFVEKIQVCDFKFVVVDGSDGQG